MKMCKKIIYGVLVLASAAFAETQTEEMSAEDRLYEYTKLTKALVTVEKLYVDKLEFKELVEKTISGLLSNLDSHSSYLDKEKLKSFNESTNGGNFGGIGISVGMKDKILTIISPIEDTPGEKIGLKSGDRIVKIDDESSIEYSLEEGVSKMRGEPGSVVKLTVIRKGEEAPLDFSITREIIKIKSVKSKYVEKDNIAYIRVTNFDRNVVEEVEKELKKYPKTEGVVLDLRNNPGGLLNQAVGLVDLFIDEGDILLQKGRTEENNSKFWARKDDTYSVDMPLVVLVNNGSASASEIVSGSLQDHKRAVIVGKQTFGKGSVQAVIPFEEDEAIKVTIARYYLPSGRTIQAKGVVPDIECNAGEVLKENDRGLEVSERDLKNHLEVKEYIQKTKEEDVNKKMEDVLTKEDILKDNQLNTAINTLKTIRILKGN